MTTLKVDYQASVNDAIQDIRRVDSAIEESGKVTKHAGLSFTELNSAVNLAQQAYGAVKGALEAVINPTVALAEQQRDLARNTGATIEQSGLLIQVADDLKVDYGTLTQSIKAMVKQGLVPNIDTLGTLSDEYRAIQDPVKKTEFAIKNFGRAGLEMTKILEIGSEGLQEMGEAALKTGLVMDEEAVQAARDYEIAMDDLNDSVMGLKVSIGTQLIPVVSDLATQETKSIGIFRDLVTGVREGNLSFGEAARVVLTMKAGFGDADAAAVLLDESLGSAKEATGELTGAMRDAKDPSELFHGGLVKIKDEAELAKDAENRLKAATGDLNTIMAGAVGNELDAYEKKQASLKEKINDAEQALRDLHASHLETTPENLALIRAQEETVADLRAEYQENAKAHEETTERIVFGFLQQRLAVDGLQEGELAFLAEVGKAWGLYDEKTAAALSSVDTALSTHGLNAKKVVDDLTGALNAIPTTISSTINVHTNYTSSGTGPGGGGEQIPLQHGGSFIVPPGFPHDSFRVGLTSGERVTVTPAPQTFNIDARGAMMNAAMIEAVVRRVLSESGRAADVRRRTG